MVDTRAYQDINCQNESHQCQTNTAADTPTLGQSSEMDTLRLRSEVLLKQLSPMGDRKNDMSSKFLILLLALLLQVKCHLNDSSAEEILGIVLAELNVEKHWSLKVTYRVASASKALRREQWSLRSR